MSRRDDIAKSMADKIAGLVAGEPIEKGVGDFKTPGKTKQRKWDTGSATELYDHDSSAIQRPKAFGKGYDDAHGEFTKKFVGSRNYIDNNHPDTHKWLDDKIAHAYHSGLNAGDYNSDEAAYHHGRRFALTSIKYHLQHANDPTPPGMSYKERKGK